MKQKFKITMTTRHKLEGLFFVTPFIIGLMIFFLFPFFMSIKLSFGKVKNIVGFDVVWSGFGNYIKAFLMDVNFLPTFWKVVRNTLIQAPLIIVFALLIAILINKDIKGKGFFRTIFFIPFLLGTGEVMRQLLSQGVDKQVLSLVNGNLIPKDILMYFGPQVVKMVEDVFGLLVTVLWSCGVQILLFLSGLQGISPALYESAKVDGATQWEVFWKITLPMISPILLLNIIYTLVDSFTNIKNPILSYIQEYAFKKVDFEYAAAMGWIYFSFIIIVVGVVFLVMKNYIHTSEMEGGKKRGNKMVN